jgi:large subunit ribosomal protein L4
MKHKIINTDGKEIDSIELLDKIFMSKPNKELIKSIVNWQRNHLKIRTAKTKQRNEIRGSTAKIYAQKGTGGARHSSRKAPIFVGGGVAHGPKGAVYKVNKLNKKVRKLGLLQLLSYKKNHNAFFIVEDFKDEIKKTKIFNEFLKKNKFDNSLIVSDGKSTDKIRKSSQNIPNLKIIDQIGANVYDLLKYKNVIFTSTSIKLLQERLSK